MLSGRRGMDSGLRVSDIVRLNAGDAVNKTHISIIEKKTGKPKTFCINDKLKSVLKEYTKGRELTNPLFAGKQGWRLNRPQVCRIVSCRALRRSFGYHHYRQFKDSAVIHRE